MPLPQELVDEMKILNDYGFTVTCHICSENIELDPVKMGGLHDLILYFMSLAYQAGHIQGQIDGAKGRFQDFKEITIESQLSASLYNSIFEKGRQAGLKDRKEGKV